jgi:hypothetical protein
VRNNKSKDNCEREKYDRKRESLGRNNSGKKCVERNVREQNDSRKKRVCCIFDRKIEIYRDREIEKYRDKEIE